MKIILTYEKISLSDSWLLRVVPFLGFMCSRKEIQQFAGYQQAIYE
jgi:hypothetical protein